MKYSARVEVVVASSPELPFQSVTITMVPFEDNNQAKRLGKEFGDFLSRIASAEFTDGIIEELRKYK